MSDQNFTPDQISLYFPVCGVKVYKGGLVILRQSILPYVQRKGVRGMVEKLSRRSSSNFVLTVGSSSVKLVSMSTLTYGADFPLNGARVKQHFRGWLLAMKREFGAFEYAWFFEFQARGAPHLHVLLSISCPGKAAREFAAMAWARVSTPNNFDYSSLERKEGKLKNAGQRKLRDAVQAQHRRKKTWDDIRLPDGALRYAVKYACKPHQKRPPVWFGRVGRFVGWSAGLRLADVDSMGCTEDQVRELIQAMGRDMGKYDVLPKIIFHSADLP